MKYKAVLKTQITASCDMNGIWQLSCLNITTFLLTTIKPMCTYTRKLILSQRSRATIVAIQKLAKYSVRTIIIVTTIILTFPKNEKGV